MAKPKGSPKTGGRKKGTPNRSTEKCREAIAMLIEDNADKLAGWLDDIAEDDPKEAFKCFMSCVEYFVPKLSRAEVTGEDGAELIQINIGTDS